MSGCNKQTRVIATACRLSFSGGAGTACPDYFGKATSHSKSKTTQLASLRGTACPDYFRKATSNSKSKKPHNSRHCEERSNLTQQRQVTQETNIESTFLLFSHG